MPDIIIDSLTNYLSSRGIHEFKKIIANMDILASIREDLEDYLAALEMTRWLDSTRREFIINNIREYLTIFLDSTYHRKPEDIYNQWLTRVNTYCFQGGFGHSFAYPDAPHHWVIHCDHYSKVSSIPPEVQLACSVLDKYIQISCEPMMEKWSG